MARYVMKQKWLSLGNDYKVLDESGHEAFYIDGRALSLGDKLSFQDMSGREPRPRQVWWLTNCVCPPAAAQSFGKSSRCGSQPRFRAFFDFQAASRPLF